MTQYTLRPFKLINKHSGETLTHKKILELAKEKGFFENEFRSCQIVIKENGTPVILGYNPLVSFSLPRDDYLLEYIY